MDSKVSVEMEARVGHDTTRAGRAVEINASREWHGRDVMFVDQLPAFDAWRVGGGVAFRW
jgi:hypothetical protein